MGPRYAHRLVGHWRECLDDQRLPVSDHAGDPADFVAVFRGGEPRNPGRDPYELSRWLELYCHGRVDGRGFGGARQWRGAGAANLPDHLNDNRPAWYRLWVS